MIISPDESRVVSSVGWVDKNSLWTLDTASDSIHLFRVSDANYISLHYTGGDFFSAMHHYSGEKIVISAHSFERPEVAGARLIYEAGAVRFEGDKEIWKKLPRAYTGYLKLPANADFHLLLLNPAGPDLEIIGLEWYDASYDKDYQGIVGVAEVPESSLAIISIQRDSRPVLYDLKTRKAVNKLTLAGRSGNPCLRFRRTAKELWADDYDTLIKIDPDDWQVRKKARLQGFSGNSMEFIGNYAFSRDETLCAVARPFSGDVVALDTQRFKVTHYAKLGGQPLEVCLLNGGVVYSRDWKTGKLLKGNLKKKWFA